MQTGDFTKLQLKEFSRNQEYETNESRFWKSFNIIKETKLISAPKAIDFHPVNYRDYIVTSSLKVHQFDGLTDKITRSYSRFQDEAYSGKYRYDGKLIIAGEKTGRVKVFDTQNKLLLRQLKGHNGAVHSTIWNANGANILSSGDDKKINLWDIATEEILWTNKSFHTDYIRSLSSHPFNDAIFASGSYDHTVALWDTRISASSPPQWSVNHGKPVESIMFSPNGNLLITAGGSEVKLWDVLNQGKLLYTFNNHQKNVTSLAIDPTASRLLSGGLDGHVKIYNFYTLQVVHNMKFNQPIMSINISKDNKKLAIGFVNGDLQIRNNRKEKITRGGLDQILADNQAINNKEYDPIEDILENGINSKKNKKKEVVIDENQQSIIIETHRQIHLQPYEKHLKKFNYQKALDASLQTQNPIIITTLIEELCKRNGLTIALSGRDETNLEPLLTFITHYINHDRYNKLLCQITHKILDIYSSILGCSDIIDELFLKLLKQINTEVEFEKDILKVLGEVECISNVSMMPSIKKQKIEVN